MGLTKWNKILTIELSELCTNDKKSKYSSNTTTVKRPELLLMNYLVKFQINNLK